ncbi:helix-turn-helix domain-containing protein [Enterococcus sp. HMSC072H05]|uniref:helix-turn-helix domain-containing protein n=1 Tax=Enterococcus sp. HMSC072H05 TaxID=1715012 RepID=UPI0008A5C0C3|nr:helix-turn-helix domain-containing protein [Enterococcus sp. HMSC072H05]OFL92929.1 hypothetical protein HMPREF2742_01565 [Enterococcus sp. HMSC072H05]
MENQTLNLEYLFTEAVSNAMDKKFEEWKMSLTNNVNNHFPEYMDMGLACEYLGVSRNTLTKYIRDYSLPIIVIDGIKRLSKKELDNFMITHQI